MASIRACSRCGGALPKKHRKYCISCSPLASALWKRAQRVRWRGTPYALDPWLKKAGGDEAEARRLRSEYMREYRLRVCGASGFDIKSPSGQMSAEVWRAPMDERSERRPADALTRVAVDADNWEFEEDLTDCAMGPWRDEKRFVAKGACPRWSEVEAGVFSHFYSSGARLPAGTYRCILRHDEGICLQRVDSKNDETLLMPDPVAESLIREAQKFWLAADDFRRLGFLHKRGFLLMGPAGCGKTSIINQVAEYVLRDLNGVVLLVTDPARAEVVLSNLRQVEPERPLLAVIEDIDAMLGEGSEERLLSLLDGKTQVDHILFIATTNYPERLDQRLMARPSRFDRVELIGLPSAEVRRAYLENRVPDLMDGELARWIELSEGFSLAHLKELVLAVRCLGTDVSQAAHRLKSALRQKHSSEKFTRSRMGFSTLGRYPHGGQ